MAERKLQQSLSRFDGTMIVMGTIIGIGIFFTPSRVVGSTGSTSLALAAWLVGSLIAMAGAFTYAALGVAHPRTGGPYVYLREAFGKLPAFLYGWMVLMAIGSGAIAVIGLVFADYLSRFFPMDTLARNLVAAGTIGLLTMINVLGVRWGSRVLNLFTLLKIGSLLFLVVVGLVRGSQPLGQELPAEAFESAGRFGLLGGFVAGMVGVLFSFGGWQNLANVAGEMKRPEKDLPVAVTIGVLGVALIYVLANVAYFQLLPVADLVTSNVPAAAALEQAIGPRAGDITAALILCSAFGILNGLLLSLPRIYYAMALDGLLPGPFATVHARFHTPVIAILAQGIVATGLVFWGSVAALTDYVVFADWLFFALNGFALFQIVRAGGGGDLRLKMYGYPWVPLLFTLMASAVAIGILVAQWGNASRGLVILGVGVLVYALRSRRRGG